MYDRWGRYVGRSSRGPGSDKICACGCRKRIGHGGRSIDSRFIKGHTKGGFNRSHRKEHYKRRSNKKAE